MRKLLSDLASHPVTRNYPILLIDEDDAATGVPAGGEANLHVLKHPVDWEDLLGEMERLIPMFGRTWNDPLLGMPSAERTEPPTAESPEAQPEAAGAEETASESLQEADGSKIVAVDRKSSLKILCIDDDPVVVRSIAMRLEPYGIAVKEAGNGTQGYLTAMKEQPDLIVLDLNMPGGEGNYVLSKLKEHPRTKDIPVVVLTVETAASARRNMIAQGAEDFLCKPVHWPDLFGAMGRCVQLPKRLLDDYHLPEQLTVRQL